VETVTIFFVWMTQCIYRWTRG